MTIQPRQFPGVDAILRRAAESGQVCAGCFVQADLFLVQGKRICANCLRDVDEEQEEAKGTDENHQ